MIGTSKLLLSGGVDASPSYSVYLTPSFVSRIAPNGGYTTPPVTADVVGGSGNYSYLWEVTEGEFTVNNETLSVATFSTGGFNFEQIGKAKLTVTDTGNGNLQVEQMIELIVNFGGV